MGVFKRIKDMTKASVNDMLDKVEDPIVMLNQYLRDMEAEIHEAEVTVAKQMANERRMKQRLDEAERTSVQRESQAEAALANGQEEVARKLWKRKSTSIKKLRNTENFMLNPKLKPKICCNSCMT